jgi:hypothetical protein
MVRSAVFASGLLQTVSKQMPSVLTRRDYEDSLVTFYFGRAPDYLSLCQKHAYRDLQRTLHGIGKQQFVREKAQKEAHAIIARSFSRTRVSTVTGHACPK